MEGWWKQLRFDPLPQLLSSVNEALLYFVKRDLSGEEVGPIETLWQLPHVIKITSKQQDDGSWKYHGGKEDIRSKENYNQLETYRILGQLVEKYGLNRKHSAIKKAAELLFSFQTEEGDFRGIYGNQYTPNYTAAIMELLIKAGYNNDSHIERGFSWLLSIRQSDGGWAVPLRTVGTKFDVETMNADTIKPDLSKPFSHMVTGVVLRAFATHEKYRKSKEAITAGKLLASRFFKSDKYPDRQNSSFWTKFSYPFWFTDIISSLDSLSFIGFTKDNSQINNALNWLKNKQQENGLFELKLLRTKDKDLKFWVSLAVCRIFKRFYG